MTTAQTLGRYHSELLDEGIPKEAAETMVIEAARALLSKERVTVNGQG